MSITKPFTFVTGTKARANEVNQDFDVLYSQVNANISNIAENASDISALNTSKADINGSTTQRFSVADANVNTDAVNYQTMRKNIYPLFDIIDGLTVTKDSGSPEDTIIVSSGSCYDSTKTLVLRMDSSISKQNDNQGASTTYYVYVIGDSSGGSVDVLISSNSTIPTLPSGYSLFKQIGRYTTDTDGNIKYVYYYGVSPTSDKNTSNIIKYDVPTYLNGGDITTLFDGNPSISSGDIQLSEPFTNFNKIIIEWGDDSSQYHNIQEWDTYWLNYALERAGSRYISLFNGGASYYWSIYGYNDTTNSSTTELFKYYTQNSLVYKIFGCFRK